MFATINLHVRPETKIVCKTGRPFRLRPGIYATIELDDLTIIYASEKDVKRLHEVLGQWLTTTRFFQDRIPPTPANENDSLASPVPSISGVDL